MKKFEHKRVILGKAPYNDLDAGVDINSVLKKIEEEGWELVSVVLNSDFVEIGYFKKQIFF